MIAALLSILGSSAVGSLIGGVFAILNRRTDLDVKRMELEHEKSRWDHDLALRESDLLLAREEAKGRLDVAVVEGDAMVDTARMNAIAAANAADKIGVDEIKAAGKLGWVFVLASAFNKLIRPTLTVLLAFCALYINWLVIDRLVVGWADMAVPQRYEAGMQAFAWVTAQASTAFAYWFVSRGSSNK